MLPFRRFLLPFSSWSPSSSSSSIPFLFSSTFSRRGLFRNGSFTRRSLHNTPISRSLTEVKQKQATGIEHLTSTLGEIESKRAEQNRKLKERIRPIVADMERAVCAPNGRSQLLLIGSLASGLAMDMDSQGGSDIDLAFYFAGADPNERRQFMEDMWGASRGFIRIFLGAIADALQQFGEENPEYRLAKPPVIIAHTFVPIIIGKFANGTTFDIQFPRRCYQAIRNTLLIKHCAAADPRFAQLFHWLRRVFMMMGVKNSKDGLFSSYHTLLLVLHFLQRKEVFNNVLPVIWETHRHLLPADIGQVVQALEQESTIEWTSQCRKSVGELALELVWYYAQFDPRTTTISIAQGRTIPIPGDKQSHGEQKLPRLQVFDPFNDYISTRSHLLGEALTVSFQFLQKRLSDGHYLATFPQLDGITEDFAREAKARGVLWHKMLSTAPDVGAPMGIAEEAEAEEEEGEADGDQDEVEMMKKLNQ